MARGVAWGHPRPVGARELELTGSGRSGPWPDFECLLGLFPRGRYEAPRTLPKIRFIVELGAAAEDESLLKSLWEKRERAEEGD